MTLTIEYYNKCGRIPNVGERFRISTIELEVMNVSVKSEPHSAFQQRFWLDCYVLNPGHVYDEMKRAFKQEKPE